MTQAKKRITGLDVARAWAILGMIIVNYKLAMGAQDSGPAWLNAAASLLEGRASALFVVLAGIGTALMTARARGSADPSLVGQGRSSLYKRALFLMGVGLLLLSIGWSADILHYYGVFLLVGAALLSVRDRLVLALAAIAALLSLLLQLTLDYSAGWAPGYHEYTELWSIDGFVRNLLFNGFHPLFPWLAFYLMGLWMGRKGWLAVARLRRPLLWLSIGLTLTAELLSWGLSKATSSMLDAEATAYLFTTKPMPPTLLYVGSSLGTAIAAILICLAWAERFHAARLTTMLIRTGQLSLTHYIGHIVLVLVPLQLTGVLENGNLVIAVLCSLLYFILALLFSFWWRQRHERGPIEWLMRKLG